MNDKLIFRVLEDRGTTLLVSQNGKQTWSAQLSGKLRNSESIDQPTVGDWVEGSPQPGDWIYIESVRPRMNLLSRQSVSGKGAQKLGANVDYLFIATALNQDFNLNRLDRFVAMALNSQVQPVIILTKIDLVENPEDFLDRTAERFPDVNIHAISTLENWNLESLNIYFQPDLTVALMGSSGVGKSTLVNTILKSEVLDTGEIRADDGKGKHTTTHRSLHFTENGAWLMDTPGLRGLELWDGEEGLQSLFGDIESLAGLCKFTDCQHETEPGCQIQAHLESGELDSERWKSYLKLKREEGRQKRKVDKAEASKEKQKWKARSKELRKRIQVKYGR